MLQLCRGLEALHAEGLMHRDVKPSNTLLSASAGAAKLADCGLARPLDGGERPAYTHAVATRWYRAPELLYGARAYGPAVDIWALGLVFAELLGLAPLIPGDNDIDQLGRVISTLGSMEPVWPGVRELPDWGKIAFPPAEPVPLGQLLPGASVPALEFLARFLRYDPAQRITAAEAVRSGYLNRQSPLPADEAEISQWLLKTLEDVDASGAALKAAAAAVAAAAKGLAPQPVQAQQQQPADRQQQQQQHQQRADLMRQALQPQLAVCWQFLPLA
ncbi:hypothetical protein Vretifemale_13254 [Volvox reticuliferus]|nr:hypothetical protein Vretifemale_13254 [Volvox reticuliferus]